MTETTQFDVIVIGAGAGGLTTAVGFTKVGKKVLLIEKERIGGDCTWTGCVPSKSLLHKAKEYATIAPFTDEKTKATLGREAFEFTRGVVSHFGEHEAPEVFEEMGITVALGAAKFLDAHTVVCNETHYTAPQIVIATGSSPRMIEVPGLAQEDILTNETIFDLPEPPKELLVVGGGAIGSELAQACALLGSKVTLVTTEKDFGFRLGSELGELLQKHLERSGVRIVTGARLERVEGSTAHVALTDGSTTEVPYTHVLMAIGRTSNTEGIGLDAAGVTYTHSGITINKHYQTSQKHIYAVGDVADTFYGLTHAADAAGRHLVQRSLNPFAQPPKVIPRVLYTSPEVATIGEECSSCDQSVKTESLIKITVPFENVDRAHTDEATNGVLVLYVTPWRGQIVRAALCGPAAGELIAFFTQAIERKTSMWRMQGIVFAYPTFSLVIKKAADQFVAGVFERLKSIFSR